MSKDFPRHNAHKIKRIQGGWRKPRGLDNKTRKELNGHLKKVKIGYGTPKNNSKIIIVSNVHDFKKDQIKDVKYIFSSTLGKRKKITLIKEAEKLNLKILNIKSDFIKKVETELKERKDLKQKRKQKKEDKQKELDKKAKDKIKEQDKTKDKEKSKLDNKLSEEDQQTQKKKEKDKILIKKEGI